jgi:hypothetical protein
MNEEGLAGTHSMARTRRVILVALVTVSALVMGCGKGEPPSDPGPGAESPAGDRVRPEGRRVDSRPPPMAQPVPLWEAGKSEGQVDAATAGLHGHVLVDVGDAWTPYLFSETVNADGETRAPTYRATYLALARGEFPDNHHGERAKRDKYLELYGIMPTLTVLRERFRKVQKLDCAASLDLTALDDFQGFISYRSNDRARWAVSHHGFLQKHVQRMLKEQGVDSPDALDAEKLDRRDTQRLREYRELDTDMHTIRAAQKRLECEGYMEGKGRYVKGGMDWATHEALAEFERRHRIYGWGYIGRDTLHALRLPPAELERRAVVRVLTERAMHAAGVIEDGSTAMLREDKPRTFKGADGKQHPIRNLEAELQKAVEDAFGLHTPEGALAWLESLGELSGDDARYFAIRAPELPEYYDGDMDLSVEIDRGDVWYEFPYDENGKEVAQPVQRRPRLTIFTRYLDQRIPLARLGTTIGGWRSETVDGAVMWKYKESPVGERIWHQIVAAPVWLPPATTPARELLKRQPGKKGKEAYDFNYHESGPSYASAYGLVAAYHIKYRTRDGEYMMGGDEGIRTHGSVDYMSIMRRNSHGCHRLHNHLAVRLMSFVLAHRPHRRVGQQSIGYRMVLERDGHTYDILLKEGGYPFELERPVHMNVLEGRIRGDRKSPIAHAIPKFNDELGAYIMPDGTAVKVKPNGQLIPYELPPPDEGTAPPPADSTLIPWEGGQAQKVPVPPAPAPAAPVPAAPHPREPSLTNVAPSR